MIRKIFRWLNFHQSLPVLTILNNVLIWTLLYIFKTSRYFFWYYTCLFAVKLPDLNDFKFRMKKVSYIHCTRCCTEASPSCLKHKQQIEIFYGTEIEKLRRRKQYECKFCFKIGYSNSERITCRFCRSRNIKVLNWYIPNKWD